MIKRLSEKEVFKSKIFKVKELEIQSDQGKFTFQIIEKNDTALIVPIKKNGNVIFIREYFAATNQTLLSLPKGRVENGLSDLETANKELQEEIGFRANKLSKLAVLTMSPGYLTQKTHVYLAEDLEKSSLKGDEIHEIEEVEIPLDSFEKYLETGELNESRTIAALYLARKALRS